MSTEKAVDTDARNPAQAERANERIRAILARSATDLAFRQKLLTDPRAAIAEFAGRPVSDVPESFNLVFVENKAGATFVLPDPINPAAELSPEELESVAGGIAYNPMQSIAVLTIIDPIIDPIFDPILVDR
jgi:hypothetical protein